MKLLKKLKRGKQQGYGPLSALAVTLLIYFGSQIFAGALFGTIFSLLGKSTEEILQIVDSSVSAQFGYILAVEAVSLVALYAFVRWRSIDFSDIGIRKPTANNLLLSLPAFVGYFAILLFVFAMLRPLIPGLDFDQEQQIGFESAHGAGLVLVFVSLVILPAIVEEILVRGFLYGGFKKYFDPILSAFLVSIVFAVAHLQLGSGEPPLWVAAIDTFILSMVLIWLRERTGNIWAGVLVHMMKNALAFLTIFVFKSLI